MHDKYFKEKFMDHRKQRSNEQFSNRRFDTPEQSLERAQHSAAKFRAKYRNLKNFLLQKGVPQAYFDEYNAQFNAEYEKESMA